MSDAKQAMVVYSDGSSKPNPGFIGFGVHGYTYVDDVPKKNYGGKNYKLTAFGYAVRDKASETAQPAVTPVRVFDGFGSCLESGSNNTAEIMGVKQALALGLQEPIQKLLIKTDSEYARRGYSDWIDKWAKNNWMNREGQLIANVDNWKDIYKLKNQCEEKGLEVQVEWVKGHVGLPGNEKADKLANIGRINSEANKPGFEIVHHTADEYWGKASVVERHPLCSKPWMYIRGKQSSHKSGEYYFGNIGKDEDFLGKRDPNGSYSIVQLTKTDPLLDMVRNIQTKKGGDDFTIYVVSLRALYSGERANDLLEFGENVLVQVNPRRRDLFFIDSVTEALIEQNTPRMGEDYEDDEAESEKDDEDEEKVTKTEPLTREQVPQKLSARVFDCLTFLKEKLDDYKAGNARFNQYFDITNEVFQIETKATKGQQVTSYKLKSEFKVGVASFDIKIQYEGRTIPVRINLGIDAPERNSLKRLETLEPKLMLVVWKESESAIRYALVVECKDATSIWAGFYSNLIFLEEEKK